MGPKVTAVSAMSEAVVNPRGLGRYRGLKSAGGRSGDLYFAVVMGTRQLDI